MRKRLKGLRVAVLAADGFEQVEATIPMSALRRVGADVRVISLRPGRIRGMNFLWRGRKLPVDDTVFHARPEDYGALLLPGGFVNPDLLRQSERALAFVRRMDQLRRPIATLCHGPEVLISSGLVSGRRITSWPGIAADLRNAGAEWVNAPVIRDGRWVSSRGAHDLAEFIPATIQLFERAGARHLGRAPRRWRWAAELSRAATLGLVPALALGARRLATDRRALRGVVLTAGLVAVATWLGVRAATSRSLARRGRQLVSSAAAASGPGAGARAHEVASMPG
jgi:protease I